MVRVLSEVLEDSLAILSFVFFSSARPPHKTAVCIKYPHTKLPSFVRSQRPAFHHTPGLLSHTPQCPVCLRRACVYVTHTRTLCPLHLSDSSLLGPATRGPPHPSLQAGLFHLILRRSSHFIPRPGW